MRFDFTRYRFLNLDGRNLRAYHPTQTLFDQLLAHPQEMIPIMDMTVNEHFLELFPDANDIINNPIQVLMSVLISIFRCAHLTSTAMST